MREDARVGERAAPSVNVSKVIAADPTASVMELTVSAKVKPSDADAVKQRVFDQCERAVCCGVTPVNRAATLVACASRHAGAASESRAGAGGLRRYGVA